LFNLNEEDQNNFIPDTKYQFLDMNTVIDHSNGNKINKNIFIKYSPLLNACKYTIDFYDMNNPLLRELPKIKKNNFQKIDSIYNFSYIDGFFCYLCSKLLHSHNCFNMLDYYGSNLCVQDKFKIDITDDFSWMSSKSSFFDNNNKYFTFSYSSELLNREGTNKNKTELNINEDSCEDINLIFDNFVDIDISSSVSKNNKLLIESTDLSDNINEYISNKEDDNIEIEDDNEEYDDNDDEDQDNEEDDDNDDEDNEDDDDNEEDDDNEDEDDEEDDDDDETEYTEEDDETEYTEEDDEKKIYAYINNFPVQMIYLEKCENTIDSLFMKDEITEELGLSFMMQITFSLILLQKIFHFTHNDLHTNNIMYNKTELEYVYYKYNSIVYKIPTYGYLFKIIDFGRGIYKYNNIVYCSDSYSKHEDAHTQYNFEPFYNNKLPIIEPNYSFDLCRLGISIYDMIMDPVENYEELSEFQKWIYRICLDDNNKSVIYKKNGSTRYSGFKLYRIVAKTVHHHNPSSQLNYKVAKEYIIPENEYIPNNEKCDMINIDIIPCYV
jgi:hypothetical protein